MAAMQGVCPEACENACRRAHEQLDTSSGVTIALLVTVGTLLLLDAAIALIAIYSIGTQTPPHEHIGKASGVGRAAIGAVGASAVSAVSAVRLAPTRRDGNGS